MSHIARADTEIDRLTQMVLEEEGKLAALFEPGKPMPSVGQRIP